MALYLDDTMVAGNGYADLIAIVNGLQERIDQLSAQISAITEDPDTFVISES